MWGRPGNIEAGARKSGTGNDAVKKYRKCVVVINLAHLTQSGDLRRRRYFAEMFRGHRGEREKWDWKKTIGMDCTCPQCRSMTSKWRLAGKQCEGALLEKMAVRWYHRTVVP